MQRSGELSLNGYAQGAASYDRDPNPVVALVRRILEPLLSDVRDKVLVDIGCGTGQDPELAVAHGARAVGLDFTPEMLREAARKPTIRSHLVRADATSLPLQSSCADVIVCSFVPSFITDISKLADQLAKIDLSRSETRIAPPLKPCVNKKKECRWACG